MRSVSLADNDDKYPEAAPETPDPDERARRVGDADGGGAATDVAGDGSDVGTDEALGDTSMASRSANRSANEARVDTSAAAVSANEADAAPASADDADRDTPASSTAEQGMTEGIVVSLGDTRSGAASDPQGDTVLHAAPTKEMPRADTDPAPAPTLRDVTRTAGSFARGRLSAMQVFLQGHRPMMVGIFVVIALLTLGIVLFVSSLAGLPPDNLIIQDTRAHLARSSYDPGLYGHEEALAVESVRIIDCSRADGQDDCLALVEVDLSGETVTLSEQIALTYELDDGSWTCTEVADPTNLVYTALTGVDEGKVIENIGLVLGKADSPADGGDASALSLPALYSDAEVTLSDTRFDAEAQDETLSLHLSRATAFTSYECDLSARFVFRPGNGLWELASASVSKGAKELSLTPVVGSWRGDFVGQVSTGGKCFGAKEGETRIVIDSVGDGRISGTLTGTAHYHGDVTADVDGSQGDTAFESVSFTGTQDPRSSGISFICTTPEDAKGGLRLRLDFGTPEDPNAANATITTTSDYQSTFIVFPYEREARFEDSFSLTKE